MDGEVGQNESDAIHHPGSVHNRQISAPLTSNSQTCDIARQTTLYLAPIHPSPTAHLSPSSPISAYTPACLCACGLGLTVYLFVSLSPVFVSM